MEVCMSRRTLSLRALICPGTLAMLVFVLPAPLLADGFMLARGGRYIPESHQRAFIEWRDGQERLYVATRSRESFDATLWVVPIPAKPERVMAEPVASFPQVWAKS